MPAPDATPPSLLAWFARTAADWSGTSTAFALAALLIVVWGCSRPLFDSFDTWQLVINTATTIITFLMVFLIQRAQNQDARAVHLKLNELVAAVKGASNRLINVEDLTEEEVRLLHAHYAKLVELATRDERLTESHSIEDAKQDHAEKQVSRRKGGRRGTPPTDPPSTH